MDRDRVEDHAYVDLHVEFLIEGFSSQSRIDAGPVNPVLWKVHAAWLIDQSMSQNLVGPEEFLRYGQSLVGPGNRICYCPVRMMVAVYAHSTP